MSTLYRFISDGSPGKPPAGDYLITIHEERSPGVEWSPSEPELAYRPEPNRSIVWGPPVYGERLGD